MKRKVINHYGDWVHYPVSNLYFSRGIKPPRNIDKDGDGIVDWEDCDPNDKYKQGLWSSIKKGVSKAVNKAKSVAKNVGSAISKAYTSVDKKVGGVLPGGAPKSSSSSNSSSSRSSSKSSSSGSSSSRSSGGGGSSGGSNSSSSSKSSSSGSSSNVINSILTGKSSNPITELINKSKSSSSSKMSSNQNMSVAPQSQMNKNQMVLYNQKVKEYNQLKEKLEKTKQYQYEKSKAEREKKWHDKAWYFGDVGSMGIDAFNKLKIIGGRMFGVSWKNMTPAQQKEALKLAEEEDKLKTEELSKIYSKSKNESLGLGEGTIYAANRQGVEQAGGFFKEVGSYPDWRIARDYEEKMENIEKELISIQTGEKYEEKKMTGKELLYESTKAGASAFLQASLLGGSMSITKNVLQNAGKKVLVKTAITETENQAAKVALNTGGMILKAGGTGAEIGLKTYFYVDMAGNAYDITENLRKGKTDQAIIEGAQFVGAIYGFKAGEKFGGKLYNKFEIVTGNVAPSRTETGNVKTRPTTQQIDELTKGKNVDAYRRGPLETGGKVKPKKDKYSPKGVSNPTEQVFMRYEPGAKTRTEVTVPAFAQGPKWREMFMSNWQKNEGLSFMKRLVKSYAETPIANDVLIRQKVQTTRLPKELREKMMNEMAVRGELSKTTKKELMRYDNMISDKVREYKGAEEEELVLRKPLKVSGKRVNWVIDESTGKLVPVVESATALPRRLQNIKDWLVRRRIITKQDAVVVNSQLKLLKKYGADLKLPREHGGEHLLNVKRNIEKLIDNYPEFHDYFVRKYGSLENAKREVSVAGILHDLGKTRESSNEFGTKHGPKVANVIDAGLFNKGQKFNDKIVKAVRLHEEIDPRKVGYKVKDKFKLISPEEKILATADRIELARYGMKVDPKRLPLPDAMERNNVKVEKVNKRGKERLEKVEDVELKKYIIEKAKYNRYAPYKYNKGIKRYGNYVVDNDYNVYKIVNDYGPNYPGKGGYNSLGDYGDGGYQPGEYSEKGYTEESYGELPYKDEKKKDEKIFDMMYGDTGKSSKDKGLIGEKKGYKKQLAYEDPLMALTGKNKYSKKMNIDLTKRYGSFST
jgi:hypothetical protein